MVRNVRQRGANTPAACRVLQHAMSLAVNIARVRAWGRDEVATIEAAGD